MKEEKWNEIKQFYLDSFGISPDLVDLLADNDILVMCASGSSNKSISAHLDIDIRSIKEIIQSVYSFPGWEEDIEFNPLQIFNELLDSGDYLFGDFKSSVTDQIDNFGLEPIRTGGLRIMFRVCKLYESISERLEKEWV